MEYLIHIVTIAAIFAIIAVSFDIVVGYAGLFSIAPAAFYGIGAYSTAIFVQRLQWGPMEGIAVGALLAATASLVLAYASVRISGEYLAITSYGFQVIVFSIFNNWDDVTRGARGIPGVPGLAVLGTRIGPMEYAALAWLVVALVIILSWRLTRGDFGRVLKAVREDEIAAQALGKDITRAKVASFIFASTFAAIAGSLFAHHISYVDPTSFSFDTSMLVLSMVIIGGSGRTFGPMLGAILLVVLPELLRLMDLPSPMVGPVQQAIYALLLILMIRFRPRGLIALFPHRRAVP